MATEGPARTYVSVTIAAKASQQSKAICTVYWHTLQWTICNYDLSNTVRDGKF